MDGVQVENFPSVQGRTYYVNNITGSSTNDGLSWGEPFQQVSEAISASETYRELGGGAPTVTTNDYVANSIIIQGTATAYTTITDIGERCYIIGMSAGLMRCGGSGQVRIGATDTDGCDDATNARGNTLYNIQFQAGGDTMYCFRNTAWIQRSRFQDVTFNQVGTELEAAFYSSNMSGTIFERCTFAVQAGATEALYGMYLAGQFSDCLITDCIFNLGSTASLCNASESPCGGSVVCHNFFLGGQSATQSTTGFYDRETGGNIMLAGNYFAATANLATDIDRTTNNKTVGNMLSGTGTFVSS